MVNRYYYYFIYPTGKRNAVLDALHAADIDVSDPSPYDSIYLSKNGEQPVTHYACDVEGGGKLRGTMKQLRQDKALELINTFIVSNPERELLGTSVTVPSVLLRIKDGKLFTLEDAINASGLRIYKNERPQEGQPNLVGWQKLNDSVPSV